MSKRIDITFAIQRQMSALHLILREVQGGHVISTSALGDCAEVDDFCMASNKMLKAFHDRKFNRAIDHVAAHGGLMLEQAHRMKRASEELIYLLENNLNKSVDSKNSDL